MTSLRFAPLIHVTTMDAIGMPGRWLRVTAYHADSGAASSPFRVFFSLA